jgi:hypothetical protein
MWRDEVERVLRDDYLGDLPARPLEEIRAMRTECREIEDKVSYRRRIIQGRLDILAADLRRRADGGAPGDLRTLVESLPDVLSDKVRGSGPGRLPSGILPPDDDITADLDSTVGPDTLGNLPDMPDEAVGGLARTIGDLEREVSDARRGLFGRIDALNGELARRYGNGEADPGAILR